MRLRSFRVKGFKNFEEEVVLDDLGSVNVLHGENNVGKSNLLQALDLYCHALSSDILTTKYALSDIFPAAEIFHRARFPPPTIEISAEFGVEDSDELDWAKLTLTRGSSQDPHYTGIISANDSNWLRSVSHALIGIDRRRQGTSAPPADDREVMSADLCLQLFDAHNDRDPEIYKPWRLFNEAMGAFQDLLGEGTWLPLYDRKLGRALLVFETKDTRYPLRLLGSGVQQVAALLANILLARTSLVSIEEPELNLRYSLQHKLREVLRRIVGKPGGPDQIFLTSHSPAFEVDQGHFYWVKKTDHGAVVQRRPAADARLYTEQDLITPPAGRRAPLSYVTSDGLIEVPKEVRDQLGLAGGGGVVFVTRQDSGHVEMLSDEQYLDLFQPEQIDK